MTPTMPPSTSTVQFGSDQFWEQLGQHAAFTAVTFGEQIGMIFLQAYLTGLAAKLNK